ncbi:hypothetical protein [Planktothrix paucivesiculata]|nr:hypothetical protein [Planktothrix paucivesiculata]
MRYPEEDHAQDLYKDLTEKFVNRTPPIIYSIKGAGVHWGFYVKSGCKICSIECFDKFGSPEYFISFGKNSKRVATGRTSSKLDTINAVDDWIKGDELSILYKKFSFIDRSKRDVIKIYKELVTTDSSLSKLVKIERCFSDYQLWFKSDDRAVYIGYNHQNKILDASCRGDNALLFKLKTQDRKSLAKLLKRWLCDRALPSQIQTEFPWVEMGNLADFYEKGNLFEGEVLESWNSIENFYESNRICLGNELTDLMIKFIKSMRQEGYDRYLRAGQSVYYLNLSRSRKHGYLGSYISFWGEYDSFHGYNGYKEIQCLRVTYSVECKTVEEFEEDEIILTPRIRNLLHQLAKQPIN